MYNPSVSPIFVIYETPLSFLATFDQWSMTIYILLLAEEQEVVWSQLYSEAGFLNCKMILLCLLKNQISYVL